MQRMKIVHCVFTMKTGGAQVMVVSLINEMCLNHDVTLIIVNDLNEELVKQIDKKVKIYFINRRSGSRNPFPILRINFLLLQLRPDIIHCHEPNMVNAIKSWTAKLVHTIHDVDIPVSFYELYDSLVAISDAVYKDVTARCHLPVCTVHNGIPTSLFRQRQDHTPPSDGYYKLVQISRLVHEKKGHDILLYALHKVVYGYGFKNLSLDIIGEGPSLQFLKALVTTLNLDGHVNFLGDKNRDWIFNNLRNYHILVQPSRFEGFGLTILEGFAAGLPVLATNIDGPAEIISRIPGGFLFENGDVDSCVQQLRKIFTLYEGNEIGTLMKTTTPLIKQTYSIKACTKGYLAEYSRIRNRDRKPVIQLEHK